MRPWHFLYNHIAYGRFGNGKITDYISIKLYTENETIFQVNIVSVSEY